MKNLFLPGKRKFFSKEMMKYNQYKKKGSNKDFWEYRIYYQDPITRKTKEKSKKGFTSKPEAKLAAEEMERQTNH